jgi:hypothetical protein
MSIIKNYQRKKCIEIFKGQRKTQTFFKCIRHKRLKNSVHLLFGGEKVIAGDTKMTEVLNLFFFFNICQRVNCLKARQAMHRVN